MKPVNLATPSFLSIHQLQMLHPHLAFLDAARVWGIIRRKYDGGTTEEDAGAMEDILAKCRAVGCRAFEQASEGQDGV